MMKLFQYWDTGSPPDQVAAWIDSVRAVNADLDHRLFDRDRAGWFIGKHVGRREQRAFEACAVPAMQSDYFRLCALKRSGGVYLDADFWCLKPLSDLLATAPHGLLESRRGQIVNGLMFIRQPADAFVDACLSLCTLNIERRDIPNVYTATGPGVLCAIQAVLRPETAAPLLAALDNDLQRDWLFPELLERARREIPVTAALVRAFDAITLTPKGFLGSWIGKTDPAYKQTSRHWLNWPGSIYVEGAAACEAPGPA